MKTTRNRRQKRRFTLRHLLRGGKSSDKYILLSCPEFEQTVDALISQDGPVSVNGAPVEGDFHRANTSTAALTAENKQYLKFLKEIGIDVEKSPDAISNPDNQRHYLRKINNFETEHFYRGYINWSSYGDKSPDIRMNANTTIRLRGAKVVFFLYLTFNEPNAKPLIDQLLFLNSLTHYGIDELNIVLPYFPVGTMERIVGEGEIPTAHSLAQILNSIPEAATKNSIYIFDIHALCSRFFFHSNARPVLLSMMPEYINHIARNYPEASNLNIIVFPDDGAKKRFDNLLPPGTKKITCAKTRKGADRIIKIESGMEYLNPLPEGKAINLFLIDDLVQTGGSVLETFDGINREIASIPGADKVNYISIITHSVFPDPAKLDNFFGDRKGKARIHKLITTNTRPLQVASMVEKYGAERIEVIDISKAITTIFTNHMDQTYITPYIIN
jgi:phosphoribosylpyrophosphate synthetase